MKFKVSKKEIKRNYYYIVKTGYCNLQNLLYFHSPIAYSARSEGWACDYYEVKNVIISTGYAPLASQNTKSTYEIEREYDGLAEKIINDRSMDYEERKNKVDVLLHKYIEEIKAN